VRSFGLMPEFVSHDWHVQPDCQRPNRDPPERRAFSPDRKPCNRACARPDSRGGCPYMRIPTVLETLQTYRALKNAVNQRIPQVFQMISTSGMTSGAKAPLTGQCFRRGLKPRPFKACRGNTARSGMVFRRSNRYRNNSRFSAHAKTEDRKLIKELVGGPCFEGTLQNYNLTRQQAAIRGSESNPVAGTIKANALKTLDAGRRRELRQNRPASHTTLG